MQSSNNMLKNSSKSLFIAHVDKKNAELEAQKIKNRIDQLRQEHEKILKRIQADDQKAESIYKHRLELQMKKEEKIRQKVEAPPPFSLSVSRAQRETLKKIKEEMLYRKKTEVKEFRDIHKKDLKDTKIYKNMDQEANRTKVLQGKEEEKIANQNTLQKLRERRNKIRTDIEEEKFNVLKEKYNYDETIQELESLEQRELEYLQHTQQLMIQTKEKVNLAQSLPPMEFEKKFGFNSSRNNYNSTG